MSDIRVKVCGLTREEDVEATAQSGAAYCGLVFFAKSPRHLSVPVARDLALAAPLGLARVGLMVNPQDAALDSIMRHVPIDMIQLHGTETPERVNEIRARFGLPVMKAVGLADEEDLPRITKYQAVADQILIDAKPPKGSALPGGNGLSFDWTLLKKQRFGKPWMLAGGLTPDNVAKAIAMTGAKQVDVSSGVESAPGVKDAGLIRAFVNAAQTAAAVPQLR